MKRTKFFRFIVDYALATLAVSFSDYKSTYLFILFPFFKMFKDMIASRHNCQIFNSIIKFIPIYMVDYLISKKVSLEMVLHNYSMKGEIFPIYFMGNISQRCNSATLILRFIKKKIASTRTKITSFISQNMNINYEFFIAIFTDLRHFLARHYEIVKLSGGIINAI